MELQGVVITWGFPFPGFLVCSELKARFLGFLDLSGTRQGYENTIQHMINCGRVSIDSKCWSMSDPYGLKGSLEKNSLIGKEM